MAGDDPERRIAHLDMDAFFASVELLRRPELREQPVVIGGYGDPRSRGVVSTANYAARAFGIHSAMPLRQALELCPHCVFLPVDFDAYRRASRQFKDALREITDQIEDRGIDEVYLDLTRVAGVDAERGAAVGRRLKARVLEATGGLTCSIGIAPNKLLAKMTSELDKPDGLAILEYDELPRRIWPLPARRINGIGPKADQRLAAIGIRTIGELARADPALLRQHFGPNYGLWLHQAAHGRDDRPIATSSPTRSISRETTFSSDLHIRRDWHKVAALLAQFARQVGDDLRRKGYRARTIGVKVRYDDFRAATRDLSLREASDDPVMVRRAAFECLARVSTERRIRLLGVRASSLVPASAAVDAAAAADADTRTSAGTSAGADARAKARIQARTDAGAPGDDRQPPLPLFD
ncbi:MAG: DNA polymerase IV [Burkholderiaceae bacterium]